MSTPSYLEDRVSQIPALRLLMAMGWQYLTPNEVNTLRGQKNSNVILDEVLLDWLRGYNRFQYKGNTNTFSEPGLIEAMRAIHDVPLHKELIPASAEIYELLTLGKSIEQAIDGDRRSFTLQYIDWQNPSNNIYQVTDEFVVERQGSYQTRRPDIVLFVNGIPLAVIECKRPDQETSEGEKAVFEGISQMLRNQRLENEIPHLFAYTQLLLAASVNDALYGTTWLKKKYWAVWKEESAIEADVERLANAPLTDEDKAQLYDWRDDGYWLRRYFDEQESAGTRLATTQDRTLFSLLQPTRLLELTYQFILYDDGIKKIARYQQYFSVKSAVERVAHLGNDGKRAGGVIWHTTGTGKSLTMVMLAKALALHPTISNPRVVIVTDRIDLDLQIWGTFKACGKQVYKAESGTDLIDLIRKPRAEIITTVIDKFEKAAQRKLKDDNANIFVLVDESHRSQYGSSHAKMREVFPNGCYIGFTGTPLLKKDKTTAERFGGFIHKYTMRQAVADKAVVPLLYEGRMVDLDVSREALDQWFERRTHDLTEAQKLDLKRKMSQYEEVNRTQARLETIAYDIAQHYIKTFRGDGLKAQLATASKEQAIRYLYALQNEGIECEVIISAPDTREGNEDAEGTNLPIVQDFWKRMMHMHENEENYLKNIKGSFAREDGIEILIVVDKLLVGFDEPRNTVLYIDKSLREHGLLQAIARVNRLFEGKEFGYIVDYRGVLGELNEALETYNALEGFDSEDVVGTITDMSAVVETLPGLHDHLWTIFDPVANKHDNEALERFLEPEDRRAHFYDALTSFASALKVALSMVVFYEKTPEKVINTYKRDLVFFHSLRNSIKLRYAEAVDYGEYEQKIRKLMNDHIKAEGVSIVTQEVNIFNQAEFEAAVSDLTTSAARADAIAYRLKKTTTEEMEKDPAFYRKFSQMIEETIEAYKQGRIDELDYLHQVEVMREEMVTGRDSSLPPQLANYQDASAYYGLLIEPLTRYTEDGNKPEFLSLVADIAIAFEETIRHLKVRDWAHNPDVINRIKGGLDDLLYSLKRAHGIALAGVEMDSIIDNVVEIAKKRDRLQ